MVINPREGYQGQNIKCSTALIRNDSKPRGAIMVFDLTNAYDKDASKVLRGFMLGDDRRSFTIRDEVDLLGQSTMYWFMNTLTDIEIDADGKGATFSRDGKKLRMEVASNADSFVVEKVPEIPLETSPTVAGMKTWPNHDKIRIKLEGSGHVGITVKLIPQINYTEDIAPAEDISIAKWYIPDGEITPAPKVNMITVNGEKLENFEPDKYLYSLKYASVDGIPQIAAEADSAEVEVRQATAQSKEAIIYVRDGSGAISQYNILFKEVAKIVSEEGYTPLQVIQVNASSEPQPENKKENVIDGDINTRWSASNMGDWVEVDLGESKRFDALKMAFYYGNQRTTKFDIAISNDGSSYEKIFMGDTTGNTEQEEVYLISGTARYIRFIGYGNSEGSPWISVNEFIPMVLK